MGKMGKRPLPGSFIPPESKGLAGLKPVGWRVIHAYVEAVPPPWEITLEVEAQLIETTKANAQYCYNGYQAYQPLEVGWAETLLVLAEEFRDGNVPAGKDIGRLTDEAYQALPAGPWPVKVRSDSAAYQQDVLDHWDSHGWQFAVRADMSEPLRPEIEALSDDAWKWWEIDPGRVIRERAEVPDVPTGKYEKKERRSYRYLAIRLRPQQGELFSDGVRGRHFAVVTNLWDREGQKLLEWPRGKAGTIEQGPHILVNELGAGVFPSQKPGANAAWLRLQGLTHNWLQLLKAAALPEEYAKAHPKRLRFSVFTLRGKWLSHADKTLLRIAIEALATLVTPVRKRRGAMAWGPS